MPTRATEHEAGLGASAKQVAEHASALARLEIELAVLEVKRKIASLARGIAFVAASLPARGAADFSARVPNVPGTTSFRVGVSNFRVGLRRSESP